MLYHLSELSGGMYSTEPSADPDPPAPNPAPRAAAPCVPPICGRAEAAAPWPEQLTGRETPAPGIKNG